MSADRSRERLPPQNRDAERCVLGSMLRDNQRHQRRGAHRPRRGLLHRRPPENLPGIITLYIDHGQPVDLVTLAEPLQAGETDRGCRRLPLPRRTVGRRPHRRQRRVLRPDRPRQGHGPQPDPRQHRNPPRRLRPGRSRPTNCWQAPSARSSRSPRRASPARPYRCTRLLAEAYDRIDTRCSRAHQTVSGLPTGFVDLDEMTAGLQNSELVIVAARPQVGKTAFALEHRPAHRR